MCQRWICLPRITTQHEWVRLYVWRILGKPSFESLDQLWTHKWTGPSDRATCLLSSQRL